MSGLKLPLWGVCLGMGVASGQVSYIFTEAPRYESRGERFPAGAALQLVADGRKRALVPGFAASADATVSFDGRHALFSGKQKAGDHWGIWELALTGGAPRRVTAFLEDAITPFYLTDDRVVYARRTASGFQLETALIGGDGAVRLTYAPGDHLASDVLRDGRVLFDAPLPESRSALRDLFTVYLDGTGVETYRCDHGRDRHRGYQLSSGDIIFETGGRLARFTSARAVQVELPPAKGEFSGRIAEISAGEWLVAWRPEKDRPFGLYRWAPGQGAPDKMLTANGTHAVQPVLVRPRDAPKRHPSAIGNREGANLLCLNVYTSRSRIPADSVAAVRVWALDDAGAPVKLGQAPVERDGSFFVQAPGERAIRFELLDSAGKTVAAEKGWFWARRGEQRICVGCHAGPERAPENAVPQTLLRSTEPAKMALPVHTASRSVR